jgi:hypothetical protein
MAGLRGGADYRCVNRCAAESSTENTPFRLFQPPVGRRQGLPGLRKRSFHPEMLRGCEIKLLS